MKQLILIALLLLPACKPAQTDSCFACLEICEHGVVYLSMGRGITPEYNQDGTLRRCEAQP